MNALAQLYLRFMHGNPAACLFLTGLTCAAIVGAVQGLWMERSYRNRPEPSQDLNREYPLDADH